MTEENLKADMIRLLPRLRSFALRLCQNSDQADDLVQATCERAIRSLDQFDPQSRLESWMFRILQNLFLNSKRDNANRARLLESATSGMEQTYDGAGAAVSALELQQVREFIKHLDEDYQRVLIMIAIEGRSYKEVADELQIPIGTVTSRLARARLKLRDCLEAGVGGNGVTLRCLPGVLG